MCSYITQQCYHTEKGPVVRIVSHFLSFWYFDYWYEIYIYNFFSCIKLMYRGHCLRDNMPQHVIILSRLPLLLPENCLIITMLHLPFYPQLANLAKLRSVNTYKNVKLTCERVRTCWFVQVYGDVLVCMASSSSVLLFSREAN